MRGRIVIAKPPKRNVVAVGSVELTHADRPLWPGIAKLDLAEYWLAVVEHTPPGLCAWESGRRAVLALDRFLDGDAETRLLRYDPALAIRASRRGQAPA
jgi:DNA primase